LSGGGLKFFLFPGGGGSATVGARKSPEINRFHWSRDGLAPIAPPEYASDLYLFSVNIKSRKTGKLEIRNYRK